MSRLVVDCSVTMAWCFEDESDGDSDAVLDALASSQACVPSVWPLEVANVLLAGERRGRITDADSARFLQLLAELPFVVEHEDPRRIHRAVLDTGRRTGLSAYDASYLDLAMRLGAPLATRDQALRDAAVLTGVELFTPPD